MADWVFHGANVVVAACYYAIATLILVGLIRARALWRNTLGTATAAIFLTCALGHSVHALGSHVATGDSILASVGLPPFVGGYIDTAWPQAVVDALTVIPAVAFFALRRRYGLVVQGPDAILRFEQQLAARDREVHALREVDQLKDAFVAMVSHELRTPLTGIIGYSDILLKELHGPLTDKQQQHQQAIRQSAQRLLGLINDLLDVAKLEAGAMTIAPSRVDLRLAVEQALVAVAALAAAKDLRLERELADDLPPVLADGERLQQMLVNLLSNAIKFSPASGTVSVGARRAPVDASAGSGSDNGTALGEGAERVVVYVRDTGLGLPAEELERIWDRFYQVDSSPTRRHGGTGLGLAIVQDLAHLHGGKAWAESAGPDRGATFNFTLAVAPPLALEAVELVDEPTVGPGRIVVVADEDGDTRDILRTFLESEGCRVALTHDGRTALALAERLRPFAMILGARLAGLDGWSVLTALKRDPVTRDVPVIMLSAYEHQQYAYSLGALEYLTQPLASDQLRAALDRLAAAAHGQGGSILLVEDDADLRTIARELLESEGYRVREAISGEEALAAVDEELPGLVLLDLMLPGLDGFTVLRRLREHPATRAVPVVVLTAKELTAAERLFLTRDTQQLILKQGLAQEVLLSEVERTLRAWSEQRLARPQRTVLVVDDEPDVRDIVRVVVEEMLGQRVLLASDGEAGLALARAERPDLVLLDLMLPGMTGFEVARQLRLDPATSGLRLFALTALARTQDRADALLAGCDSYLDKPFATDALAERLRVALGILEPAGTRR